MTSPSSPGKMHEMSFVSKDLVTIQVGRLSASIYPKVKPSMPVFERAHAFQVAKSALWALNTNTRLILEVMGAQLNCSTVVDGLIHDWRRLFDFAWFNFNNLAIISFHNSAGTGINNMTVAGNPALLLLVINGPVANCCQQDVCFVGITCTINFTGLVTMPNYGPTMLCVGFYLKLPQMTIAMANEHNVAYNLTTWHSAANLATHTSEEVCTHILEPTLQDGPIALCPANFNLGNANINTTAIHKAIHTKILKLGFKQIWALIFTQLCPGYSNQPHAVLEHIRQTSTAPDGQQVTAMVIKYYQRMMNAVRPFATQQSYAISLCDCFIQGLNRTLPPSFCCLHPNHLTTHDLDGSYQCRTLPIILAVVTVAEDKRNQIQDIAMTMLVSQGFFICTSGKAGTYASQAEKTLGYYKNSSTGKCPPHHCWGCGGDHTWMVKGKAVCP